MLLESAFH